MKKNYTAIKNSIEERMKILASLWSWSTNAICRPDIFSSISFTDLSLKPYRFINMLLNISIEKWEVKLSQAIRYNETLSEEYKPSFEYCPLCDFSRALEINCEDKCYLCPIYWRNRRYAYCSADCSIYTAISYSYNHYKDEYNIKPFKNSIKFLHDTKTFFNCNWREIFNRPISKSFNQLESNND